MTIKEKKFKLKEILEDTTCAKIARLDDVLDLFNDHLKEVRGSEPQAMILLCARVNGFKKKVKAEALTPIEEKAEIGRIMLVLEEYQRSDRSFLKEFSEIEYTEKTKLTISSILIYFFGVSLLLYFAIRFFNFIF